MWYYKFFRTVINIPKILIYIVLSYYQQNVEFVYDKVTFVSNEVKNQTRNFYFLKELEICENRNLSKCDCLILIEKFTFLTFFKNIIYMKRIRVVDIDFFGHLGLNMLINIGFFDICTNVERTSIKQLSLENFNNLKKNLQNKEVIVLGTDSTFSNNVKLIKNRPVFICNDGVKQISNIKSEIKILSFADPMFHFSIHENAQKFISLVKQHEEYIDYLIVPVNATTIIRNMQINARLIGVTSSNKNKEFLELREKQIFTKKTHNVVTQFMLPIALNASKKVFLGSVSLSSIFDKKLWKYDVKLVNKNEKSYAFNYSFFKDRNFTNYYKRHNSFLTKIINESNNLEIL
jgi:hypothetical protein